MVHRANALRPRRRARTRRPTLPRALRTANLDRPPNRIERDAAIDAHRRERPLPPAVVVLDLVLRMLSTPTPRPLRMTVLAPRGMCSHETRRRLCLCRRTPARRRVDKGGCDGQRARRPVREIPSREGSKDGHTPRPNLGDLADVSAEHGSYGRRRPITTCERSLP